MTIQETQTQQMLTTLRTRLLVMCASTSIAFDHACTALITRDAGKAAAVIADDSILDDMENEIDAKALSILALTQPVAKDLRFVISALRIVIDLERIGDEALSIAEHAVLMQDFPKSVIIKEVEAFIAASKQALDLAIIAFKENDIQLALQVSRQEDEANQQEVAIIHSVMQHMTKPEPDLDAPLVMHIILIIRAVNRVWHRAANLAEHVYFTHEGISLKHKKI